METVGEERKTTKNNVISAERLCDFTSALYVV
jgi:hypothetical protein